MQVDAMACVPSVQPTADDIEPSTQIGPHSLQFPIVEPTLWTGLYGPLRPCEQHGGHPVLWSHCVVQYPLVAAYDPLLSTEGDAQPRGTATFFHVVCVGRPRAVFYPPATAVFVYCSGKHPPGIDPAAALRAGVGELACPAAGRTMSLPKVMGVEKEDAVYIISAPECTSPLFIPTPLIISPHTPFVLDRPGGVDDYFSSAELSPTPSRVVAGGGVILLRRANKASVCNHIASPGPVLFVLSFRKWESCRTMPLVGEFSRDLPFPPLLHYGAAPSSPPFALIDSQDLCVESRPNLFTLHLTTAVAASGCRDDCRKGSYGTRTSLWWIPYLVIEQTNDMNELNDRHKLPEEIFQYLMDKHGISGLVADVLSQARGVSCFLLDTRHEGFVPIDIPRACAPGECVERYDTETLRRGAVVSPLASHQSEPGSIPGRVAGFSHVGIVPDDAPPLYSRVFSILTSITLIGSRKTSLLRDAQISSLTYFTTSTQNVGFVCDWQSHCIGHKVRGMELEAVGTRVLMTVQTACAHYPALSLRADETVVSQAGDSVIDKHSAVGQRCYITLALFLELAARFPDLADRLPSLSCAMSSFVRSLPRSIHSCGQLSEDIVVCLPIDLSVESWHCMFVHRRRRKLWECFLNGAAECWNAELSIVVVGRSFSQLLKELRWLRRNDKVCRGLFRVSMARPVSLLKSLQGDAGAAVAERLACSPPTKANRVQSPAGSLSDFRIVWRFSPRLRQRGDTADTASCITCPIAAKRKAGSNNSPPAKEKPGSIPDGVTRESGERCRRPVAGFFSGYSLVFRRCDILASLHSHLRLCPRVGRLRMCRADGGLDRACSECPDNVVFPPTICNRQCELADVPRSGRGAEEEGLGKGEGTNPATRVMLAIDWGEGQRG
ncbi:hypothetical protein PR048_019817 [Dryococelus australis]|uniref:CST complex subunit CTC1 n=1 Tax=Dryococelus australis TaxID=614101 RepID=A0ABQ9H4J6_9NEOP|nr:hypothetical protein PR048_019817 [Dryococelus australis]